MGFQINILLEVREQGRLVHPKCPEELVLEGNIDATYQERLA